MYLLGVFKSLEYNFFILLGCVVYMIYVEAISSDFIVI